MERAQRPGESLANIRGVASKAAEQAVRLAAVQLLYEDADAEELDCTTLARGIALAGWYLSEALRLLDSGVVSDKTWQSEKLRLWLLERWNGPNIDLRTILRKGPRCIRQADLARRLVEELERCGWLEPLDEPVVIEGCKAHKAWRIVRA